MNDRPCLPTDDDSRFDRLVDGELSQHESRLLLASLDDEPGGWRRCALAFLEARALEVELGAMRREAGRAPAKELSTPRSPRPVPWKLLSALAVSLLVAFGLGVALRGWSLTSNWFEGAPKIVQRQPRLEGERAPQPQPDQEGPLGNLTLVVDGGNGARDLQVSLPVYDEEHGQKWLSFERSAIPADVRRALERLGHKVEQQQQVMGVELSDGRQVLVPVEQYRIVPVSRQY